MDDQGNVPKRHEAACHAQAGRYQAVAEASVVMVVTLPRPLFSFPFLFFSLLVGVGL